MEFKDSGTRRDFGTGAVRDMASGKGRFDLLPFDAIQEMARVYETGSQKYGDRNWEGGIPVWAFMDSAARHLHKAISGHTDEPHLPMAMWNVACAIQTEKWVRDGTLPANLGYPKPIRLCCDEVTDTVSVNDTQHEDSGKDEHPWEGAFRNFFDKCYETTDTMSETPQK